VKFETEAKALDAARGVVAELLIRHPLYPQLELF